MFADLFKSKSQREMEREIAIQRALTMHRQHAAKLQNHERQYMEKALRAKKAGDKANFSRLCRMVAQTINERRGIESQLLYFETLLQTRDKVRLYKDFATGMKAMARSIGSVYREFNAAEVLRDVETSLAQSSQLEMTMGLVLDRISTTGMGESQAAGSIAADEVERIVMGHEAAELGSLDKDIEAGLKAIEREMTGER